MKKGQSRRPTLRMIASICAISLLVTVAGSFPAFAIEAATVFENGVYNIKNVNSGMMLDVANGTNANGTNVWQYTPDGTNAQKWKMVYDTAGDFYYIKAMISSSGTNRQLDVYCTSSDPVASGHNVQIWVQGDDPSSTWSIVHVSNGRYKIVLKQYPTLALTVASSSTSSGANVIVQTYSGSTSQLWTFEEAAPAATSGIISGGVYRIGIISGTSFVTVNGNIANGTTLFRNLLTPGKQEWKIHYLSNGYYVIRCNANPALAMYATSGGVQIRTVSTTNNSDLPTNAQWKIVKNDGNTTTGYRLVSKSSQGNALTYSVESNSLILNSVYTGNASTQRWWFFGVAYPDEPENPYAEMGWRYMFDSASDYNYISSGYKPSDRPDHYAVDVVYKTGAGGASIYGTPLKATTSGKVVREDLASTGVSQGNYIVVESNDIDPTTGKKLRYSYMHMKDPSPLNVGDTVQPGTLVGYVGNTGNVIPAPTTSNPQDGAHLHFAVLNDGSNFDYNNGDGVVNPLQFFPNVSFLGDITYTDWYS